MFTAYRKLSVRTERKTMIARTLGLSYGVEILATLRTHFKTNRWAVGFLPNGTKQICAS